jgi:predicted transcriptional regulator of viral defense system
MTATPAPSPSPIRALHEMAAANHGVFTRADALACGLSDTTFSRRVLSGYYVRIGRGVYRVSGHPVAWLTDVAAAVRATSGLAARRTALALHRVSPTRRAGRPSVVVPSTASARPPVRARIHRSSTLADVDTTLAEGIPCCTVPRALVDHAAEISATAWRELAAEALRTRATTVEELRATLQRAGPIAGTSMARTVLDELDPATAHARSAGELAFVDLVVGAGLPRPNLNYELVDSRGAVLAELDAAYVDRWLAFEIDGAPFHSLPGQLERDEMKDLRVREHGWDVRRVPARALRRNPRWVVARVRAALEHAAATYPARHATILATGVPPAR